MPETAAPSEHATAFIALCASGTNTLSLERLLASLGSLPEAAIVLILQHREALDENGLRRVLAEAGLDLATVADGEAVLAGRIYLPDSNVILDVEDGCFRTRAAERNIGHRGTIDSFLVSLARDREGRVIAVALDGTSGDGTLGFKAVKESDGLPLAEMTEGPATANSR